MALSIDQVYRDWNTQAVPTSGDWEPRKPEIRALLKQIQNSGGQSVTRNTFAALSGVTPPTENYMGVVLTGAEAGYYSRVGGAWVFGRGFPDTFARLSLAGSGTAQTGGVEAGVNPADIEVFFAPVTTPNTGAFTLSISGETPRQVVNLAGNPLSAGEWTGVVMFFINDDGEYQLMIDAGAAAAAAASASLAGSNADRAEAAADEAEAVVAGAAGAIVVQAATDLPTTDLPGSLTLVRTSSHNLASKLGGAVYKRVDIEPTHALWEPRMGGGYWDLSVSRVDATMAGAIGDGSYDNGQVFVDLFGYASILGAEVFLPAGRYSVSAPTIISLPNKPPALRGAGGENSLIVADAGDYDVLTMIGGQGGGFQGIGIRKDGSDHLGRGLVLTRGAYQTHIDLRIEGFDRNLYLENYLSSVFVKTTLLDSRVGVYATRNADSPFTSHPNALSFIHPTWGTCSEFAGWFESPASLLIQGGSIENNGTMGQAYTGGVLIKNPGAEGGVGATIDGVHMERNRGDADIYIIALENPDTVVNVERTLIMPISSAEFTQNRIYVENTVAVTLNASRNSFKHLGSYVPNAARKYINAANKVLVSLNISGDARQFHSPAEFPIGFGSMGKSYGGRVAADGSVDKLPSGWSSSRTALGTYLITLPAYLAPTDFAWTGNRIGGAGQVSLSLDTEVAYVAVTDSAGAPADGAFSFNALGI